MIQPKNRHISANAFLEKYLAPAKGQVGDEGSLWDNGNEDKILRNSFIVAAILAFVQRATTDI
jgi:hypothetical protein